MGALTFLALFAPLALIGGWKYQGASGSIVYKITAAFSPQKQAGGDLTFERESRRGGVHVAL